MPFLRVIRDKRGYETTYLMHWYREGARQRSRILYIFRTPGGVRVGREPLDPDILRDIETQHPEIAFDWKAVLDNRQIVEPAPDLRRPRKRPRRDDEAASGAEPANSRAQSDEEGVSASGADSSEAEPEPGAPKPRIGEGGPKPQRGEGGPRRRSGAGGPTPRSGEQGSEPGAPKPQRGEGGRPAIPSALEGATPDEQIAFLARWYPIVRERIPQRTVDEARREALLALAERLNPAAWTDADQIVAGLQQAGEALERLSRVFARRRRRSRRPKGPDRNGPRDAPPAAPTEPASLKPEGATSGESGPKPQEVGSGEGGPRPQDVEPDEARLAAPKPESIEPGEGG